jgi:fructose-bisphosphate aldolase class I
MRYYKVHLPGAILKTSMVLPGKDSGTPINTQESSQKTVKVLHEHVPGELGGVVFLSGGQTPNDAFQNLNLIKKQVPHPWNLTFSYSRALQDPVLKSWAADINNIKPAQTIFVDQLKIAKQATLGKLDNKQQLDDFVSGSQDL